MKISNLPSPTEHELELGNKSIYFNRMFQIGEQNKHNLTINEFTNWVHKNYQSISGGNPPLTYQQSKKL